MSEARCSSQWFENLSRYTALKPPQFATLLNLRRSPLVRVLPCRLSYLLHHATQQSAVLDGVRDHVGPAAKLLYGLRHDGLPRCNARVSARSNGTLREGCDRVLPGGRP